MVVGSFPDDRIPDNLASTVNGTMYISTIGWTRQSATYLLAILPITFTTILTFICALYSILKAKKENCGDRATFDPSNVLHLIMTCAAGNLTLAGFTKQGIIDNEDVMVRLDESKDDGGVKKKLMLADASQSNSVASQENGAKMSDADQPDSVTSQASGVKMSMVADQPDVFALQGKFV
jgi:hypothetical protein